MHFHLSAPLRKAFGRDQKGIPEALSWRDPEAFPFVTGSIVISVSRFMEFSFEFDSNRIGPYPYTAGKIITNRYAGPEAGLIRVGKK
jgi:hypothetical protein